MPTKPRHPCRYPGCPMLVNAGAYCAAHASTVLRAADQRRRPHDKGGGASKEWRTLRRDVLAQCPRCECGAPATVADHIIPKRLGGTDDPSNLQGLCASCHSRKTATRDGGFGNRVRP